MQERLFRFGITGLVFALSILFWYWYLGGSVTFLTEASEKEIMAAIIGFISTPALGFIVSSIFKEMWQYIWPKEKYHFLSSNLLTDSTYIKKLISQFVVDDKKPKEPNTKSTYSIEEVENLFVQHQLLLRNGKTEEIPLSWLSKRMDVAYNHINGIYSILYGAIIGFLIVLLKKGFSYEIDWTKFILIFPVILYIIVAYRQAKRALREVSKFERGLLVKLFGNN